MDLDILAKQLLLHDNVLNFKPRFTGCLKVGLNEDKRKINIEFVNNKKNGLTIYHDYYGDRVKETIDEFLDGINYNTEPFVKKVKEIISNLSIKYYGVDLGFKKTIEFLFSKKRKKSDIEFVGDFYMDDIFLDISGKIVYDDEVLLMGDES